MVNESPIKDAVDLRVNIFKEVTWRVHFSYYLQRLYRRHKAWFYKIEDKRTFKLLDMMGNK